MSDCDVVVAGAGGAGLAAALAAAQAGRTVVLAEARETFRQGSNTAMSTSMIPAAGTRWQAEAQVTDSPARFLDDIRAKTHGQADPVVAVALTTVAAELVDWLADACGVPLELVTDFSYPGHSAYRCHSVPDRSGASLHRALLDAAANLDDLHLVVPARLVDVRTDERGAVRAAVLQRPDGSREEIDTAAVVLATNGFAADADLVGRHLPEIAGGVYHGGEASRGDALHLAERLGLDTGCLDAYQGHGSLAVPESILLTWAVVMHGGWLADAAGRRFGDETVGYSEYAVKVLARPGGRAWAVYDQRIHQACLAFKDYLDVVEAGAVRWADDLAQLAAATGLPVDALTATMNEANAAASGAGADRFGRTTWAGPLRPPFAAVRVTGALFHTQGGLLVDRHARVLRGGTPVPGLYAAGGAAVGISGHGAGGYLAGNGLLAALGLGFLAGRHAADHGSR
ncbi:FAD-dependent oxidoreductase [Micromonospora yangpuensis]|uniref:Fumarate reductase flavoprotein subunit n=1 Tax=Micromonospora yangpuensis TaxID=683228 RepID=A0A1C6UPF2_9ACTN|nr:FAD-dependent oxidoreductase [Micromonospora yangpuensis]GGM08343.1 fumarate reductase flavoprotein subunit [Micromonospora yangpuensis]SCL55925.1 fumarate reductase flavoprotein subunit [Micromonospora yangpuensis]